MNDKNTLHKEPEMKILLVEDNPIHLEAAKAQLSQHEITFATGFDQALDALRTDRFDVVLTDVMIPKGSDYCMSKDGLALAEMQGPMPYGPVLALHALQAGIRRVGILTAGNHHDDPFVYAFDHLQGFTSGDMAVVCSNSMIVEPDYNDKDAFLIPFEKLPKDWAMLLASLPE